MATSSSQDIELFLCYAHEDEELRQNLEKQLRALSRQGLIDVWHDGQIFAGAEWEGEINKHLNTAQIILLLISPDFMDSDYCYGIEMRRAMDRHWRGEAHVIPIILRPTLWQEAPFGKLQALPTGAIPIVSRKWHNQDEAFLNIAEGIKRVVNEFCLKTRTTARTVENSNPIDNVSGPVSLPLAERPLHQHISFKKFWLVSMIIFIFLITMVIIFSVSPSLLHTFITPQVPLVPISGNSSAKNLLTNGSFEQGTRGWICTPGMDIQAHQEGVRSWIRASTPLNDIENVCHQILLIKPIVGKTYTVSVLVYTTASSLGGDIILWMFDDNDPPKKINSGTGFTANSSHWTSISFTTLPVSQSWFTSMQFEINIHNSSGASLYVATAQLIQNP